MLTAALASGTLESASAQSASKTGIKNVVLVHGAFADGFSTSNPVRPASRVDFHSKGERS
jgi:hypothetical protein